MNEKHNEQILEAIRNNDRRALQEYYNYYRELFVAWSVKNYQLNVQQGAEIYQQVYVILYKNVLRGKLVKFSSKPLTYMCSVGRNLIISNLRTANKDNAVPLEELPEEKEIVVEEETAEEEERQLKNKELVQELLAKIGDPCAKILRMLFVSGMDTNEVREVMDYSDERVVRKRKSLCLKRMREMVQEKANPNLSQE